MGMKFTTIYRTQATSTVTVSTVHVRDGRSTWYETALIVGGKVTDPVRQPRKAEAGIEHDAAVAFARGYHDAFSVRHDFYAGALAAL